MKTYNCPFGGYFVADDGGSPEHYGIDLVISVPENEDEQAKIRQDILPSNRSVNDPTENSPERAFAYQVSKHMRDGWFMLTITPKGDPLQTGRFVTPRVALVQAPKNEELIPGRQPIWSLTLDERVFFGILNLDADRSVLPHRFLIGGGPAARPE